MCGIALGILTPIMALADPTEIPVRITYSDAAIEQLEQSSEQVIVNVTYSAPPATGNKSEINEIGMISLGSDEVQVLPSKTEVALSIDGLVLPDGMETSGPILVNVNVYSARLSSEDNILNCDFFEGALDDLRTTGTDLHCFLIAENKETKFKS